MKRRSFISGVLPLGALAFVHSGGLYGGTKTGVRKKDLWHIQQFEDSGLAHFSYAILAAGKIILIDPERNPSAYYRFAEENNAGIAGIIETHPHADFISSHLEIHKKTGATIYTSGLTKPAYSCKAFDEGEVLKLSDNVRLYSLNTPGHSPDSISVVLQVEGKDVAVFSGDSLLIGDVGRPDLREYSGDVQTQRRELAAKMYHTLWNKFDRLADDVVLYPAHGAGSLCGRAMRKAANSTIGYEKQHNYVFEKRPLDHFVDLLLEDLPMIPAYFTYDVALNIKGAPDLREGIAGVEILDDNFIPPKGEIVIDTRPDKLFKSSHIPHAFNIQDGSKFETWLGSVIAPDKKFYLVAAGKEALQQAIGKLAKIGYELRIKGAFVYNSVNGVKFPELDINDFNRDRSKYTIIDVRSPKEFKEDKIFDSAINIPINELLQSVNNIPQDKPVLVSCASGYRSAIGSSILKKYLPSTDVFDLGAEVEKFKQDK